MGRRSEQQTSLDLQLARIPTLGRKALLDLWREAFGEAPKSQLRREVLIPILAYRLQERVYGGLKPSTERRLRNLVEIGRDGRLSGTAPGIRAKPGTRFVREWKGKLHEVSALPTGYEYEGRTYDSLSKIARVITGTRWSGPAFFGLKTGAGKRTA